MSGDGRPLAAGPAAWGEAPLAARGERGLDLPAAWTPRGYQSAVWKALLDGVRRVDVVAHRRWGKDDVALHWAAISAAKRPGVYWHLLPEAAQARRAIWSAVNPHTGQRRIDEAFPPALRRRTLDEEMRIEMANGAVWQVLGSDNYERLVGAPPCGIVFSEWALARPQAWEKLRPILAENDGWALFIWTPQGRNHAVRAFEARARSPDWFTLKSPATETDVFTPDQLAREEAELVSECGSAAEGRARFEAEYLVSFDAAAPGAYFAEALSRADRDGRITRVPHDPALPVDTAWDLGISDFTAIWFFQQVGREVRVIDYVETSGVGLVDILAQEIRLRDWTWGRHYLPHDVMQREYSSGVTRAQTLRDHGLSRIEAGVGRDPEERINASRRLIPICWFDAERCALGLDRLRAYRKRWDRGSSAFAGPRHDDASHAADAFGEYAMSRILPRPAKAESGRAAAGGALGWMG